MDDREQEYLDVLNQKLKALLTILKLTEQTKVTGEGDEDQLYQEAENYATLYERRANIITKIEEFDKIIANHINNGIEEDKKIAAESKTLADKMKSAVKSVTELDKKNMAASEKLMGFLKGNIKKMRDGRGVNNAYIDMQGASSGNYFDSSN